MKKGILIIIIGIFIFSCSAKKSNIVAGIKAKSSVSDTIRIANDSLEYEIIIIDSGFNTWLNGTARPRGYYSISYLENRNYLYVTEWNNRVSDPLRYDHNLYEMRIEYQPNINYGYEVNYLLYNYFLYFENQYKQNLRRF
ncbi:DUF6146 family protein [Flavobacterium luteum]|uniref:Lipoprotein n=1 Tax=Flavobacterium luteum TaxID=2026654 RepID=A0A7J5A972_9FLAO|nr:DUF6146 family protein [Flavobacterium luteum]KAB1154122.1 hypothetical protein F6464_13550 [Flavobacterium luteum]